MSCALTPHDTYAYRRYLEDDDEDDLDEDEDEESSEPYERVSIRVTLPKLSKRSDLVDELTFERWIPWDQVYGVDEDAAEEQDAEE